MMKHSIRSLTNIVFFALALFLSVELRAADWLIDPSPFHAIITTNSAGDVAMENGLVRRVFKIFPNALQFLLISCLD